MIRDIEVFEKEDGSVILHNVPYGEEAITVCLRRMNRHIRQLVRQYNEEKDPERDEKMHALLISRFGDRDGVTAQELINNEKYEEAFEIIDDAIGEYIFKKRYRFVPTERSGLAENHLRPEQQNVHQLQAVG